MPASSKARKQVEILNIHPFSVYLFVLIDDSDSGEGEMNTQHLNQKHEDALSLTNSLQSDV